MKRKLLKILTSIGVIAVLSTSTLTGCSKATKENLTTVKLNEVVRSVFYAPMYAAINNGYFEEQGIKIDLSTGQGADKTMQQVISGSVDIGFCGPEQVIYVHNQKDSNLPVVFAQLTQKDGSFLVGRKAEPNFDWNNLKGKNIIGGRPGGMPEMSLEYVMKKNGIDKNKDVTMITNLDFTATSGAFKSGTGDYVALFEPTASMLEKDGSGSIVASVGEAAGNLPYTCFFTTENYMKDNPQLLEKFTAAIYKGQQWVLSTDSKEVAKAIQSFFPGTDINIITKVIDNYKKIDAYAKTPVVNEEDMNRLMDIIENYDSKLIPTRPAFNKMVNNSFAEKAIK